MIDEARRKLDEERDHLLFNHDWFTGKPERLERAEAAVSEAILDRAGWKRRDYDLPDRLLIDQV